MSIPYTVFHGIMYVALKEDLIMAKHYDKQFKIDAVQYYHNHKELGLIGCASNLGISHQSLSRWQKELR